MSKGYINPYRRFYGSIIPNWLLKRSELGAVPKLVYARLSQFAGENGMCWPSYASIAAEIGMSVDHVRRCVRDLADHKLIEIENRTCAEGGNETNIYRFLDHEWMYDNGEEFHRDQGAPSGAGDHRGTAPVTRGVRRGRTPPPAPVTTPSGARDHQIRSGNKIKEENQRDPDPFTLSEETGTGEDEAQPLSLPKGKIVLSDEESSEKQNPGYVTSSSLGRVRGKSKWESDHEVERSTRGRPKSLSAYEAKETPVTSSSEETLRGKASEVPSAVTPQASESAVEKAAKLGAVIKAKYEADATALLEKQRKAEARRQNLEGTPQHPKVLSGSRAVEACWNANREAHFPMLKKSNKGWDMRELAIAKDLVERYGVEVVNETITYLFERWKSVNNRIFKGKAELPSLFMLGKLHDKFVQEASLWNHFQKLDKEVDSYNDPNSPISGDVPEELMEQYRKARDLVKGLQD